MDRQNFEVEDFEIDGPRLIKPKKHGDHRGYFMETYRADWFDVHIEPIRFVQDNQSFSAQKGTIRGLHFQSAPYEQAKLVRCIQGALFDVALDIRPNSPSFGKWVSAVLTAENAHQLWVPSGFAHGFCTLEPDTAIHYRINSTFAPDHEGGIAFHDPELMIDWPIELSRAIVSQKDLAQPLFSEWVAAQGLHPTPSGKE